MEEFRAFPGLLQNYYVTLPEPNQYGGIYLWDSKESLATCRESELAASIPAAYEAKGSPEIDAFDVLFQLRE